MIRCCLDSNAMLEAKNIYYGMSFCPAFWDMIDLQSKTNVIFSIEQVYDELITGNDELADWVKKRKHGSLFIDTEDEATQLVFQEIAEYVIANFAEEQASHFLSGADPWLIAKCKVLEAILVTQEVFAPGARKVKIPNICKIFGVNYIKTHEMIKLLGNRFILE